MHRNRGFVLAMTLIIIALITIVTFMAVNVSTLESRTAMQDYAGSRAMYASRAGLNLAMSRLTQLRDTSWVQGGADVTMDLEPGVTSFRVRCSPHPDNTNTRSSQLAWQVESTGFYGQPPRQAQRTISAFVQQEPFSKYAYFTDQDIGTGGNIIRFVDHDSITGPVRTNGYFTFAGHPKFSDQVRSANQNHNDNTGQYSNESFLVSNGPPPVYRNANGTTTSDPSLFYHTENNGSYTDNGPSALDNNPNFSFSGGQSTIPLPTDNDKIKTLAQSNAPNTTSVGLNTPPGNLPSNHYKNPANANADYEVNYDENTGKVAGFTKDGRTISASDAPPVFKLNFGTSGAVITRWDDASRTFKNWDPVNKQYTSSQNVIDTTSQTIYVDGMTLVEGTVKGRVTVGGQYDVHITDDLVYDDPSVDVCGIIAKEDIVVESKTTTKEDRTIQATMMALNGSFYVDKYNQGSDRGKLHIFGGIIQYRRGAVGTGSATRVSTGYSKDYVYDDKLVVKPPLNFPNTGEVYVVSITDQGAAGSQ